MSTPADAYVDGYVLTLPKANLENYKKIASVAAQVWKSHGALDYKECVIEDPRLEGVSSFLDLTRAKEDETVVFAFVVFKSREHRDEVNRKVMQDPRMEECCPAHNPDITLPFDMAKLHYGGFQTVVSA